MERAEMVDLTIRVPKGISVREAEEVKLAVERAKGLVPMLRHAASENGLVLVAQMDENPQRSQRPEVTGRSGEPWSLRIVQRGGAQSP